MHHIEPIALGEYQEERNWRRGREREAGRGVCTEEGSRVGISLSDPDDIENRDKEDERDVRVCERGRSSSSVLCKTLVVLRL